MMKFVMMTSIAHRTLERMKTKMTQKKTPNPWQKKKSVNKVKRKPKSMMLKFIPVRPVPSLWKNQQHPFLPAETSATSKPKAKPAAKTAAKAKGKVFGNRGGSILSTTELQGGWTLLEILTASERKYFKWVHPDGKQNFYSKVTARAAGLPE